MNLISPNAILSSNLIIVLSSLILVSHKFPIFTFVAVFARLLEISQLNVIFLSLKRPLRVVLLRWDLYVRFIFLA